MRHEVRQGYNESQLRQMLALLSPDEPSYQVVLDELQGLQTAQSMLLSCGTPTPETEWPPSVVSLSLQ